MNLAARFNTLACATVLVGLVTFCLADDQPVLAVVSMIVCLIGWFAGSAGQPAGTRPLALPRLLVNLLVLASIINAALRASSASVGQPIVSHLGEFLVYVQLLKLFDRRTSRDESQMLTLSVFVVIAAMLTSNTLPVGACLLLYMPLAVASAMLFQLRAGQSRASIGAPTAPDQPPEATVALRAVAHGRRAAAQFRVVTGVSLITASALATIVFLLTPRGLGQNTLGRFGQGREGSLATGFNEDVRLGGDGFLQDNTTPVLDLTVEDSGGINLGSLDRTYYLRGVTRDTYQRPIWMSSNTNQRRRQVAAGQTKNLSRNTDDVARGTRLIQRVTLRSNSRQDPVLFTIWRPISISGDHELDLLVDIGDVALRRSGSNRGDVSYVIESSPTDSSANILPAAPTSFSEGPIRNLAVSILEAAQVSPDPTLRDRPANRQAANLIREHLQQNYAYTRELTAPGPDEDPIEMFLFHTKKGHCEYFASAMVALCQSVGLPARLVVGYVAADFNEHSGRYLVRQSNAHAWAEVHVGDGAWQTFDPSPPADIAAIHQPARGWLASLRHWYDSIEFGWNKSIIGFDKNSQRDSAIGKRIDFDRINNLFEDITGRLFVAFKQNTRPGAGIPQWLFPAIVITALVAFVAIRGRMPARRRRSAQARGRRRTGAGVPAEARFYADALRTLDRAGAAKPDSVPPLQHADLLRRRGSGIAEPFAALVALFYKLRFAGDRLSPAETEAAARLMSTLRNRARDARRRR